MATNAALDAQVLAIDKLGRLPRIKLVPFDEISLSQERRYLVKGLVPRSGLTVIWGPPKCGKSFWALDVAMHVALGRAYRERNVHGGPVVYCAFEGQSGVSARIEAFRQHKLAEATGSVPFYLQPLTLDLVGEHAELAEAIHVTLIADKPAVIVLDTLNRSLRGSESSDQDMGNYVKAADALREEFDCAVLIIHHCGVEGSRPRGHTSLTGAADAQIAVSRDCLDNIVAKVEWMKDGTDGEVVVSKLEPVEVGIDEDGEIITSCVVVEADQIRETAESGPRLTKNQQTMLTLLEDSEPQGLTTEEWNQKARDVGIGVKRSADLYDLRKALERKKLIYQGMDKWHRSHSD